MGRWLWLASLVFVGGCAQSRDADPGERASVSLRECRGDGWCFVEGAPVLAMAEGNSRLVAAGAQGLLLERVGDRWERLASPTEQDIRDVHVDREGSIWIAADALYRFDGEAWSMQGDGHWSLYASSEGDLWSLSARGVAWFDGTTWVDRPLEMDLTVMHLVPLGPDDAWAVGMDRLSRGSVTRVVRFDGERWSLVGEPIENDYPRGLAMLDGVAHLFLSCDARRDDGVAWTLVPRTETCFRPPGVEPSETMHILGAQGIVASPERLECVGAFRGETDFCFNSVGELFEERAPGTWERAALGPFPREARPLDASLWGVLPPAAWAGDAVRAWGSAPDDVYRLRREPRELTSGERAIVLEHHGGSGFTPVTAATTPLDPDEQTELSLGGGRGYAVSNGMPFSVDRGVATPITVPPPFSGLRFERVHARGDGTAMFVASLRGRCVSGSYVLRYDGAFHEELVADTADCRTGTVFTDVTGDDEVWVIAVESQCPRSDGLAVLHRKTAAGWERTELWRTWGVHAVEDEGDELFLVTHEGLLRLPKSALTSRVPLEAPPDTLGVGAPTAHVVTGDAQLWVGPDHVWLSREHQTLRTPR